MIERQLQALQHPLGAAYIKNAKGEDESLRPDAAKQRSRNNNLEPFIIDVDDKVSKLDDCCVVDVDTDSKLSSSVSSSSVGERGSRVKRLKVKAIQDIKDGSPKTKLVSKNCLLPIKRWVGHRLNTKTSLNCLKCIMIKMMTVSALIVLKRITHLNRLNNK